MRCRCIVFHCSQNLHEHSIFVCFCYPDMTQLHVHSDPVALYSWGFCLVCVAHFVLSVLPVSHVTTLEM